METVSPAAEPAPTPKSIGGWIWNLMSGFGLATVLLLMLALITWLATMEQVEHGLYPTLNKYFHWNQVIVLPDWPMDWLPVINGNKLTFPVPSGYWLSVLLFVNLLCGGIVRARKGWKKAGVLISHCGILLLLAAGAVAHLSEQRGQISLFPGESDNVAVSSLDFDIEIAEVADAKVASVNVIPHKLLTDLTDNNHRLFRLPNLPFDLEVAGYEPNARPVSVLDRAPSRHELIADGYFLFAEKTNSDSVQDLPGCYIRPVFRDGTKGAPVLLAAASYHPYTLKVGERVFALNLQRHQWVLPFSVRLDKFTAEYYPGTQKPKSFVSEVTRLENGSEAKVTIQMNEPMRYEGITFYQASFSQDGRGSIFEVVTNPSDKWPEYSLYVVAFGMLVHFVSKFVVFINAISRKKHHVRLS